MINLAVYCFTSQKDRWFQKVIDMLRDKGKKKIEAIKTDFNPKSFDEAKVSVIFKALKLTDTLNEFDYLKQSGYSVRTVLLLLLVNVVTAQKTILSLL